MRVLKNLESVATIRSVTTWIYKSNYSRSRDFRSLVAVWLLISGKDRNSK
jgi:hypothetical protein